MAFFNVNSADLCGRYSYPFSEIEIMIGNVEEDEKEIGKGKGTETAIETGRGRGTETGTAIVWEMIKNMVVTGRGKGRGKAGRGRGETGTVAGGGAIQGAEVGARIVRIARVETTARGMLAAAPVLEGVETCQRMEPLEKSQGRRKKRRRRRMMALTTQIQRLQKQTGCGHPLGLNPWNSKLRWQTCQLASSFYQIWAGRVPCEPKKDNVACNCCCYIFFMHCLACLVWCYKLDLSSRSIRKESGFSPYFLWIWCTIILINILKL